MKTKTDGVGIDEVSCPYCGEIATCEISFLNTGGKEYYCTDHAMQVEQDTNEVAEHEMREFGGAWGIPEIRIRWLST